MIQRYQNFRLHNIIFKLIVHHYLLWYFSLTYVDFVYHWLNLWHTFYHIHVSHNHVPQTGSQYTRVLLTGSQYNHVLLTGSLIYSCSIDWFSDLPILLTGSLPLTVGWWQPCLWHCFLIYSETCSGIPCSSPAHELFSLHFCKTVYTLNRTY